MGISVLSWIAPLITIQIVKEQDIPSSKILHIANFISENNSLLEQEIIEVVEASSGKKKSSQATTEEIEEEA